MGGSGGPWTGKSRRTRPALPASRRLSLALKLKGLPRRLHPPHLLSLLRLGDLHHKEEVLHLLLPHPLAGRLPRLATAEGPAVARRRVRASLGELPLSMGAQSFQM